MSDNIKPLASIVSFYNGRKRPNSKGYFPVYGGNGILDYSNNYNNENCVVIGRVGAYCGSVYYSQDKCWVSDNAIAGLATDDNDICFIYYLLKNLRLNERHIGTSQPLLTQGILNGIECRIPSVDEQKKISSILSSIDYRIESNTKINGNLAA